jgi:hypothetical protein
MPYVLIAVLVLLTALVFAGCRKPSAPDNPSPTSGISSTAAPLGSGSRAEIEARLKVLARGPAPTELSMGAMCYEMAAPPLRAEYVCPHCGEKTLYAYGDEQYPAVSAVDSDLPGCRRLLPDVKGLTVTLDESAFCHTCSPEITDPRLVLVVTYPDGTSQRTEGVTPEDVQLLVEFTSGRDKHSGAQDGELPLKDYLPRLEKLLGVTLPEDE